MADMDSFVRQQFFSWPLRIASGQQKTRYPSSNATEHEPFAVFAGRKRKPVFSSYLKPLMVIILALASKAVYGDVAFSYGAWVHGSWEDRDYSVGDCKPGTTAENEQELLSRCVDTTTRTYNEYYCDDTVWTFAGVDKVTDDKIYYTWERYSWNWRSWPDWSGNVVCTYKTYHYHYYLAFSRLEPDCAEGEELVEVDGKKQCLPECPNAGTEMTGAVKDIHLDKCLNGCEVSNLSPTITGEWVATLQGEYTGASCSDVPVTEEKPGKMLACGTAGAGDYKTKTDNPIDFAIGNKFFRDTDYRGTGSFPIVFTRTYNSLDLGWRFDYTQRIETLEPGKIAVRRPGGQSYEFTSSGGSWTPDPDVVERLEWQAEANGGEGRWRYSLADNTREFFDANGRLTAIRNAAGLEQTVSYSADGRTMTISGPEGDSLIVALGQNGLLPQYITERTGRTTVYDFDGLSLRRVDYPNGTNKQYLYELPDRPWLITGIIDENGHRSHTVAYDDQGRAVMSELAGGAERVEISYNADGTTTVTNALGKRTTFHFKTIHGVRKIVHVEGEPTATCQGTAMDYQFDDNGFLVEKIDARDVITRYERDLSGLELSRTEAVGLPEERTTRTEWDTELRKPRVVTRGNTQTVSDYDAAGRITSRTVTDLATGDSRTTTYGYNDGGLLETIDGPREDVADITTYQYDANGRLRRVTNALSHATEIIERDDYGRPSRTLDPNGLETRLRYNADGRLEERRVGEALTVFEYDAVGNLTDVTSPDGTTIHYDYDEANRLTGIADGSGNYIKYTLDALGNRTGEDVFDPAGILVRHHSRTYDELSRLLTSVGAEGQTTIYGYDRNDNLTATIDPLLHGHQRAYDGLNRLIAQTDPLGGSVEYTYDAHDRLTSVTDPNENTTTYVYDGLGNRTAMHSPDTGTTTYTHDAAGNVLTKTDARHQTTVYEYDALNRLKSALHADGSLISYEYDTGENGIGRLARVTDPSGSTAFEYDRYGRITARHQRIKVGGTLRELTTGYAYNAAGQLTAITYPSGLSVGYAYEQGQISAVTVDGKPVAGNIRYRPFGPVSSWHWGNGEESRRGYDLDGRLASHTLGGTTRSVDYDLKGNIIEIADPAKTAVFGYDELNRLTAANSPDYALGWKYDDNGNKTRQSNGLTGDTDYTIDTGSNRLLAAGATAYQYDANGSLIHDGEHSYQYDTRGRLVSVDEGATAEYRYNAVGQRVYKKGLPPCDINRDGTVDTIDLHLVNGRNTSGAGGPGKEKTKANGQQVACVATRIGYYANQGQGKGVEKRAHHATDQRLFAYESWRMLGEYNINGRAIQETVWLGNLPIATVRDGVIYYVHADHLGTPRVITDDIGTEVWRWESDPFGTAPANEDPDGDGRAFTYNLRFPGQYHDAETGRHYNYFREYDPSTGKYTESDPLGLQGGMNTYLYGLGNPVSLADPLGLLTWTCRAESTGGVGYADGTKICRYDCRAICSRGNEISTVIDAPGFNTSGGSHCEGVPLGTQFVGGRLSDNPIGPPHDFTVDTDGVGGVIDWFSYSSELIDKLENAEEKDCCE